MSGGAVISGGSIFTWEGAWDDPVPTGVCALPQGVTLEDDPPPGLHMDRRDCDTWLDPWWGLVNGYTQDIVYEDEESKREHVLLTLDNSDYIAISSNRFYDPLARNPLRWPMTNFYYKEVVRGRAGLRPRGDLPGDVRAGSAESQRSISADLQRAAVVERVRVGRSLLASTIIRSCSSSRSAATTTRSRFTTCSTAFR